MSSRSEEESIAALCDRRSDDKIAEIHLSPSGWARRRMPANGGAPDSAHDHTPEESS